MVDQRAAAALSDRDVDVEIRLGDVATEIAAAARAWPADLVVVGSDSRPFLARLFAERVHRKVLDSLDISVLVARPGSASEPSVEAARRP